MVVGNLRQETQVAVIGGGPGGYIAALRAAELGKEVVLVEERHAPGGVCLLEGCVPSKSFINAVETINSAKRASSMGIEIKGIETDIAKLRGWKENIVTDLSRSIETLLRNQGVEVIKGRASFLSENLLEIEGGPVAELEFQSCIVATGSKPAKIEAFSEIPIWYSAEALNLPEVPKNLLVIGGGYIGLELGMVYSGLGSNITLVEMSDSLLPGSDEDICRIISKSAKNHFSSILLSSKVSSLVHTGKKFEAIIVTGETTSLQTFDQVFAAVGRIPNTRDLNIEKSGIALADNGTIPIDSQCRTTNPNVFAIGDVTEGAMLAHKASRQGRIAAEVISDMSSEFDNRSIPAVVFTDPELAWTGIQESEAKDSNLSIKVGKFPLSALGRARTIGKTEGILKIISDAESGLILGVAIAAPHASELIGELSLAIEMGSTVEDLSNTIHPHPTISEGLMETAQILDKGSNSSSPALRSFSEDEHTGIFLETSSAYETK